MTWNSAWEIILLTQYQLLLGIQNLLLLIIAKNRSLCWLKEKTGKLYWYKSLHKKDQFIHGLGLSWACLRMSRKSVCYAILFRDNKQVPTEKGRQCGPNALEFLAKPHQKNYNKEHLQGEIERFHLEKTFHWFYDIKKPSKSVWHSDIFIRIGFLLTYVTYYVSSYYLILNRMKGKFFRTSVLHCQVSIKMSSWVPVTRAWNYTTEMYERWHFWGAVHGYVKL